MKVAKQVKAVTKRPDFSGVPGELIDPAGLEFLRFGAKLRGSPYDALLDQLAEAKPGTLLKFGHVKAKASIWARARKMGMKVSYAEHQGTLYVRFDGRADDDVKASRRKEITAALRFGPAGAIKLASALRAKGDVSVDAQLVEAILVQMQRAGEVIKQEGGNWALNPAKKAA